MARPFTLPDKAYLRTSPVLRPGEVYGALRIDRRTAFRWRKHGFPASTGGMIDSAAAAAWLTSRGCRVEWI